MGVAERERGGAVGVEMALLWVVLLLMILAVAQASLVFYAGQLALTAAQDGLRSGRYYGEADPTRAARTTAESFLHRAAGNTLGSPQVSAEVDTAGEVLRVTVQGDAPSLLPGVAVHVSREAVGGLERVAP